MTIPDSIPFSSIDLGTRARSSYSGIEQLAQSIDDHGLIQPIVLAPKDGLGVPQELLPRVITRQYYDLDAGGRRYHALKLLGVTELFHAATSTPGRPGFVLKGADEATPLKRLMTELAENLDRDNMDWRDELKLIVRAWKLAKADAHSNGEKLLMRDFGSMLGCGYSDLQASTIIHDDVIADPEFYKDCNGIRAAYSKLLKRNANELLKLQATRSLMTVPLLDQNNPPVQAQPEPRQEGQPEIVHIPITQSLLHCDSIKFLKSLNENTFDHIVCDPDYGVSIERLEASNADAASAVVQDTIEESLEITRHFLLESFRVTKDYSFCVFWYDLDHHEKLQDIARMVGWRVQRWPLIWHKTDYRSNASAQSNFCKNMEYAMVLRKPGAVLAKVQMTSIFSCPSSDTVKQFNHPFAKPVDLWKWIFQAVAIKGQNVYDPFMGAGSSLVAALEFGLRPMGSEINIDHYTNAVLNVQAGYKKLIGEHVRFS